MGRETRAKCQQFGINCAKHWGLLFIQNEKLSTVAPTLEWTHCTEAIDPQGLAVSCFGGVVNHIDCVV